MSIRPRGTPAVFLDRDGTLNREVDYLADPDALEILPGVHDALLRLRAAGFALVVVTNQSGIARGLLDRATLAEIHRRLEERLDLKFDAIESCPHHPEFGPPELRRTCDCRKPAAGMLRDAAERLDLDLAGSWIVGDSERDLAAGARVGARGILVATGKGVGEEARMRAAGRPPEFFAPDLAAAADLILARPSNAD